jgi:hypothetical protein
VNVCQRLRQIKVREEVYEVPCGSRYCPACGMRWMGDQRVQAVAAIEYVGGDVALITVTGPGRRYFQRLARERGWSYAEAVAWWNATARARWRGMHLEASGRARRLNREAGGDWRVLYRVWEFQKRGVLHLHLVVPMRTDEDRACSRRSLRRLCEVGEWWGYGFVLGGNKDEAPRRGVVPSLPEVPAGRAARYVAKYVAATGAGKDGMVTTVQRTAQRGSVLYISPRLTARSGATMTTLRARRRIYARYDWARTSTSAWATACFVDGVQRGRPPLSRAAVASLRAFCALGAPERWVDASTGEEGRSGSDGARRPCPRTAS